MGKQGVFFEEVVCDSYSRVCDSNERLKEYLEGALSKAGLESFVTVMPRRDGYRIYTGEKPDAPFVYVDVYLDGESVVVEGSSKRNLSESEMGDLARFLGISGKEAGEKLNKFRRFIDALQKHAGEDVDKLEDLKVSDAVYVDAKNRNGGSPVRYMSGERLGRPVNRARPSGSGVTRGRDYVSKVDGGQRVGKPVQRAKVSDSKASDISKISGALKLVKENFKVSGKPAEIKGITLDLKDLGGAIVSVKAYSKDKEPKITVEARTSDGKRRGFDYGIDAKASHVYGDLASLGKVEDSTPARWYQGQRIGASAVSDGDTKISVSGDIDRSLWFDTISKRLHADSAFTVEDDTKDLVSGYYNLGDGNEGHISLYPDKIVFYSYENPSDADSDPYETVVPFDFYKKVESILALLWFVQAADDAYDFIDVVQSVKKANIGVADSARVSDADDTLSWFEKLSKYLHDDAKFTVEDDKEDLVSGYYKLADGNEGHISLHPDKLVFYAYSDPTNVDSDPLEYIVLPTDYSNFDSYLGLLSFAKGSGDAASFVDIIKRITFKNRVSDADDASRTDCVFPKDSPDVNDGKCHYPLNSLARARAAIAYANKMTDKPAWYSGDLDVAGLVKKIVNAAKAAYSSIDVSPESYEPKKD